MKKHSAPPLGLTVAAVMWILIAGPAAASSLRSRWVDIESAMGRINLDGTLRMKFSLAESVELKQLGLKCEMEHTVEEDMNGRARTQWRFPGLQTCLVPEGRDQLLWRSFSGTVVKFERAKIHRGWSEAGPHQWQIRELSLEQYEIRAPDGRAWNYVHGLLARCFHPALGELRFESRGAWITAIFYQDEAIGKAPLLVADYDEHGRLISCAIGTTGKHQFHLDEGGRIRAWSKPDGTQMRFAYCDELLAEIYEEGRMSEHFSWQVNPCWARGDSRWTSPVHLASDGAACYDVGLTRAGFRICRREKNSNVVTVTLFNPRRSRLEQTRGSETLVVILSGAGGSRRLERIETRKGERLEDYSYDDRGRLMGMKRKGEPDREFGYDESGRLMTFSEK